MRDYFNEAERLLNDIRDDWGLADRYRSIDLAAGVDQLCSVVYGVVLNDFTPLDWERLTPTVRGEVSFAYHELGRQGERLCDDLTELVPYKGRHRHDDFDNLIQNSNVAQYAAHFVPRRLSVWHDSEGLDPKIMKSLTLASLSAFIEARPLLEKIPDHKQGYYDGKIENGLTRINSSVNVNSLY